MLAVGFSLMGALILSCAGCCFVQVGTGPGEGYSVNIPWSCPGMGDAEYMAALSAIVLPVAREFTPDIVLVSAGFDAALGDPLGGCAVTPECFAAMARLLQDVAVERRIVLALEGGYNLRTLAACSDAVVRALLDREAAAPPRLVGEPATAAIESIAACAAVHAKYWACLREPCR
jgi:histone deacetylase 6